MIIAVRQCLKSHPHGIKTRLSDLLADFLTVGFSILADLLTDFLTVGFSIPAGLLADFVGIRCTPFVFRGFSFF